MNHEEFLDKLEDLMIKTFMPIAETIKKETNVPSVKEMDTREMTRNIIGKIGVRIVFGKKLADDIILKKKKS